MTTTELPVTTPILEAVEGLPCEGRAHAEGVRGHDPEAPGAFLVTSQCCVHSVVQCAPRAARMREIGMIKCSGCQVERDLAWWVFVPLRGEG